MYAKKYANVTCLENILCSAEVLCLSFKSVTFLAKYCSQRMKEIFAEPAPINLSIEFSSSQASNLGVSWKGLLKDSLYRGILDSWIESKVGKVSNGAGARGHFQIRSLQRDLLLLRNKYERLNSDFLDLQSEISSSPPKFLSGPSSQDGFIIAHSLVQYFSSFLDVVDGVLVEKSPARPTLVSRTVFESYLAWLKKEI